MQYFDSKCAKSPNIWDGQRSLIFQLCDFIHLGLFQIDSRQVCFKNINLGIQAFSKSAPSISASRIN